jgi:F0F1-type ATP synthase membrane subunit c/vacuolar-type H+-ATPase subunit K
MGLLFTLAVAITAANPNANPTMTFAFLGIAFTLVIVSFVVRQKAVKGAIEKRDVASLQSGYITSFALCEAAALFGVLDHFVTGSKYFYISFAIAALGMLLHFPKRDHVRATTT